MRRQEFKVEVLPMDALGSAESVVGHAAGGQVTISAVDSPPDFVTLMCAAEYLMHIVATQSNAGYDRALELLVEGAKTYTDKEFE